ncbi:ComF family protein [Aliivibrio wodanis]|uniref:ComF family protein n=1 Tax=Aliivibrio wodanis TaxID=80852 RepID=UPI00406BE97B
MTRCDTKIVKRIKATRPQQGLSRSFRQTNLLGAFKVMKPINEKHVAIVDDVVTTGATINLLCVELRKAGVERIDVYAVCRTGRN